MPAPSPGRERPTAESGPPEFARIRDTTARYGISRSAIYREAARGNIRLLKLGAATLVDLASVRAFVARLPAAKLRAPKT